MYEGEEAADYSVAVAVDGGDHSTLLALASVLHRRGVDVLAAQLTRPVGDRRRFEATIRATPRAARTVEGTLRNLVRVTHVSMARAADMSDCGVDTVFPWNPAGDRCPR